MKIQKQGQMPPEEVFTRSVFGVILILAAWVSWGKWISLFLGVLFLLSAHQGICFLCIIYKKLFVNKHLTNKTS